MKKEHTSDNVIYIGKIGCVFMNNIMQELLLSDSPWEVFKQNYSYIQDVRLICFDNESNNLGLDFKKQNINKYIIQSFSDMENTLIIDKYNFESYLRKVKIYQTFDFDSNIVSYLREYLVLKKVDESFKDFLKYVKDKKVQISCVPYLLEISNKHNPSETFVLESLLAFFAFDSAESLEEFEKMELRNLSDNKYVWERSQEALKNIKQGIPVEHLQQYYFIYCTLLKIYEINFKSKKSAKNKIIELLTCVNKEIFGYGEQELYLAYLVFSKDKRVESFFGAVQPNSKDIISKIRGMAWDLYHLRNLETQVAVRNEGTRDLYMHYFCSRDEGISNILELNPLKRIIVKEGKSYPLHKNTIFQTELSDVVLNSLEEYQRFRKENVGKVKLYKISKRYEDRLIKTLNTSN